ncbi:MAG: hypothetical protein J6Z43_06020 [Clostridiales bacterium]|nr:hypothetical protein [Clostridiales bacterium]
MGSTLETAIVFSLVITALCILVLGPEDICLESLEDCGYGMDEISFQIMDGAVASFCKVDGIKICDCSPERFCTYISGLSDSYRIIYGAAAEDRG